eukprot:6876279-Prymnesium_polylepis.1
MYMERAPLSRVPARTSILGERDEDVRRAADEADAAASDLGTALMRDGGERLVLERELHKCIGRSHRPGRRQRLGA